jgi:MFS family permease
VSDSRPTEPDYPPARTAWFAVGALTVVYVFSFLDRQILSLLVEDLKAGLRLERDWQAGFLMGPAFAIFYTLFGFPLGRMADSSVRRNLVAAGLAMWSLMTAGCGLAKNFWQMALGRIGVGVGEASLGPSAYSIIADMFPRHKMGAAMGFYTMGIYLGSGVAFMAGGPAVDLFRDSAPWNLPLLGAVPGWQKVFFAVGLPGLLLTPLFLLTVKEPLRRGAGALQKTASPPLSEVLAYFRQNLSTLGLHGLGFSMLSFSSYGSAAWLPTFFSRVHGWSPGEFGLPYGLIVFVFGSLGILSGGILADWLLRRGRRDAKMWVPWFAAWAWFPFGILIPVLENPYWAMVLMTGASFLTAMPNGMAPASIQEMMPNRMRGQASAVYLFINNLIGLGVGPVALGWMTDYVFTEEDWGVEGVRYSLLTVTTAAHAIATGLLWKCRSCYCKSLDRLEKYGAPA